MLDAYLRFLNSNGLIQAPQGWNFMDWVPGWHYGMPPEADLGVNSLINMQFLLILNRVSDLEKWLGEKELAERWRRIANELWSRIKDVFLCKERGLFADTETRNSFS